MEVEIDESKFGKRKYNRGRQVEGHWVFGGTERITGECFLVEVDRRDAATLLPLIQQHIRRGSIIYSDEWKAYSRITATTGMSHETVNHLLHFVLFNTYLPAFMWRRRFSGPETFSHIVMHIAEQYTV